MSQCRGRREVRTQNLLCSQILMKRCNALYQQAPPIKLEYGLRFVTCVLLIYVIMDGPWIVPPGVLACSRDPVCSPVLALLCTCLEQWPCLQTCTATPVYLPGAVVLSAVLYLHACALAWSSDPVCRRACHPTRHSFFCSNSSGTVPHPPPSTGRKIPAKTRKINITFLSF